jgi:hypothetical protein
MMLEQAVSALLNPLRLYSAREVLTRPSSSPALPGLYARYFDMMPPGIDPAGCHMYDTKHLLHIHESR